MPYITQIERDEMDDVERPNPKNPGALNYAITMQCLQYFESKGGRYQQINDIIGALECVKLEFYRRLAAPYEDKKASENGDIY